LNPDGRAAENCTRKNAEWSTLVHPNDARKNLEKREFCDSSQRLVHFKKNFYDCFFCVARQHAMTCYYRLRSVIAKWQQGKKFVGASLFQFLLRYECWKDFNQANWTMSASQKSAVK